MHVHSDTCKLLRENNDVGTTYSPLPWPNASRQDEEKETTVDVTRAILSALADVHPRGLPPDVLASMVSCEQEALQGQLRLLNQTGAVVAQTGEVRLTDAAIEMMRHARSPRDSHAPH